MSRRYPLLARVSVCPHAHAWRFGVNAEPLPKRMRAGAVTLTRRHEWRRGTHECVRYSAQGISLAVGDQHEAVDCDSGAAADSRLFPRETDGQGVEFVNRGMPGNGERQRFPQRRVGIAGR